MAHHRDQLPSELSTGMKRSVAIARALAAQPEAILYDEPTTMVDPLMAHLLGNLIQKLKFQLKLTSIVVTHDMTLAKKLADRSGVSARRPRGFFRNRRGDGAFDGNDCAGISGAG